VISTPSSSSLVDPLFPSIQMNEQYSQLIDDLLLELGSLTATGEPEILKTELRFKCCNDYWSLAKRWVAYDGFSNDKEEIDFFKYIKPIFTGHIDFYASVYYYQFFCPVVGSAEIEAFQQQELGKINEFREVHKAFISYFDSGSTEHDAEYFLRRNNRMAYERYARIFDPSLEVSSSHDWILSKLTGFGLFEGYVRGKMSEP